MNFYLKKIIITNHAIKRAKERLNLFGDNDSLYLFKLREVCNETLREGYCIEFEKNNHYLVNQKYWKDKIEIYMTTTKDNKSVISFHLKIHIK